MIEIGVGFSARDCPITKYNKRFTVSDARLRELEARFRETRAVEDEAAWLRERVRVDDLSDSMIQIAALFGHEASSLIAQNKSQGRTIAEHLADSQPQYEVLVLPKQVLFRVVFACIWYRFADLVSRFPNYPALKPGIALLLEMYALGDIKSFSLQMQAIYAELSAQLDSHPFLDDDLAGEEMEDDYIRDYAIVGLVRNPIIFFSWCTSATVRTATGSKAEEPIEAFSLCVDSCLHTIREHGPQLLSEEMRSWVLPWVLGDREDPFSYLVAALKATSTTD